MEQKSINLEQAPVQAGPHQDDLLVLKQRTGFHQLVQECKTCQEEIETNWQFCAHCGVRLATECPGCGKPLPPAGAPSCLNCGLAIPAVNT